MGLDHVPGSNIIFEAPGFAALVAIYTVILVLGLSFNGAVIYVILGESLMIGEMQEGETGSCRLESLPSELLL